MCPTFTEVGEQHCTWHGIRPYAVKAEARPQLR